MIRTASRPPHAPTLDRGPRASLAAAGLLLATIGASLLLDPQGFYGLGPEADLALLSDLRASGGALLGFALLLGAGARFPTLAGSAALAGTVLFLAYGGARLLAMVLDGMPPTAVLVATAIEWGAGALLLVTTARLVRASATP